MVAKVLQSFNFESVLLTLRLEHGHLFPHYQKFFPMCADISQDHSHKNPNNDRDQAEKKI